MKLQTILNRLQKLHPKEIDLSLDRVKNLCKKLGDPQKKLKHISVVGTNGKYSTIQAVRSILKTANINCNIYTSPHIQKINERFIFNEPSFIEGSVTPRQARSMGARRGRRRALGAARPPLVKGGQEPTRQGQRIGTSFCPET